MTVSTDLLVPMTEANQNFSKVTRLVDEKGFAVILKNNRPRYVVMNFAEYEDLQSAAEMRQKSIDGAADALLRENMEAFRELAK